MSTRTTDGPRATLLRPLLDEHPITTQVLGICAALAVTRSLGTALVMGAAVTAVLVVSNTAISCLRRLIPRSIRLIVQITIIASLVIVVDQLLAAFAWEMSRRLSVFVGLIITNCIVLGRAEAFAMSQRPWLAALDGLGNGLAYTLLLALVGAVRELLGAGSLLGHTLLTPAAQGGWFEPLQFLLLPPSAFFIIGLLIWLVRSLRPDQQEPAEGPPSPGGSR